MAPAAPSPPLKGGVWNPCFDLEKFAICLGEEGGEEGTLCSLPVRHVQHRGAQLLMGRGGGVGVQLCHRGIWPCVAWVRGPLMSLIVTVRSLAPHAPLVWSV